MRNLRILSTLFVLLALAGCSGVQKMNTIPAELRGVWQTNVDPKFDGHTFELQERAIVIASIGEPGVEQSVVRVEKRTEDGKTLYAIYSLTPEHDEDIWKLYFEPQNGGTIRFVSQKSVEWTRQTTTATSAPSAPPAANAPAQIPEPTPENQP